MFCLRIILPFLMINALLLSTGCFMENAPAGPDPKPTVDLAGLFITGYAYCFPAGNYPGSPSHAIVWVWEKKDHGTPVTDLTVSVAGSILPYDIVQRSYAGATAPLSQDGSVELIVSNGETSVSSTLLVPFAPMNLRIPKGYWDVSGPDIPNTLRWETPVTLGESITVTIYGVNGDNQQSLYWLETDWVEANYLTVYNHEIPYYGTFDRFRAMVGYTRTCAVPGCLTGSEFLAVAAAWGEWLTQLP